MSIVSFYWLLIVVLQIISLVNANWVTGNLCWSMPCMNGGSCFGSAYTYLCICPINYSGALCEKRLGICQENPCGNRGLCIEKSLTSFECRCYYDYIGSTCQERVTNKNPHIWSSLLPIHTRVLFNMLQEAYRVKAKEKPILISKNGQIDFLDLLLTSPTSTTVVTTEQNETTGRGLVIQIESTTFTEQSSQFDNFTTNEIVENITMKSTEQIQSDYFDTTYDQEMIDIETSTAIPWSNDDNNTINSTESIVVTTTTQPIDPTSSNIDIPIDDNETYPSDQTTTLPINTITPSSSSENSHTQLLYKLCQQIFSHILPNGALSLNSSSLHHNNTTVNALLSWFHKRLNSSRSTTTRTSTPSPFIINEIQSSAPLQRINMDDVLHQMDNYNDDENAHR